MWNIQFVWELKKWEYEDLYFFLILIIILETIYKFIRPSEEETSRGLIKD